MSWCQTNLFIFHYHDLLRAEFTLDHILFNLVILVVDVPLLLFDTGSYLSEGVVTLIVVVPLLEFFFPVIYLLLFLFSELRTRLQVDNDRKQLVCRCLKRR